MDPRLFLSLARELADQGGPEHRRSAISRSYYAAYNVAVDLLRSIGVRIESGHGAHEIVRVRLRDSTIDALVHVSRQFRRLQMLRVKADYRMRDPQPERADVADEWLVRADAIIRDLDAVAADPRARERIRRALQQ